MTFDDGTNTESFADIDADGSAGATVLSTIGTNADGEPTILVNSTG
ncbi:MAG: hypothetical protein U5K38_17180 [Woeseiaceae bacterium]|nr:hypothetical protein [Woeseiaceae bacterium]